MTIEVTIESAIGKLARDIYEALSKLDKNLALLTSDIYYSEFEAVADYIFDKDSTVPAALIALVSKGDHFDLETIAAIEKASTLVFVIAARRFYYLANKYKLRFYEYTLSYRLCRLGYAEQVGVSITSQKKV